MVRLLFSACLLLARHSHQPPPTDPFLASERDPLKTHAAESSLWELKALQSHYLASVSGLAKIFNEVMNKQSYAMEDFLDHSYGTVRFFSAASGES